MENPSAAAADEIGPRILDLSTLHPGMVVCMRGLHLPNVYLTIWVHSVRDNFTVTFRSNILQMDFIAFIDGEVVRDSVGNRIEIYEYLGAP